MARKDRNEVVSDVGGYNSIVAAEVGEAYEKQRNGEIEGSINEKVKNPPKNPANDYVYAVDTTIPELENAANDMYDVPSPEPAADIGVLADEPKENMYDVPATESTKNNEQPEPIFPIAPSGPMYPGEERAIEREPEAAPETPEQTEQKRSEETPDFVPEWMKQAQSGNGMTAGRSGQAQPVSAADQQYIDPVITAANELIDKKLAEADPTSRENKFDQRYNDALEAILNREKFSYDVNSDELYRQYAQQYQNNAELAMRDAMARAQAATGGYGSSYSQQVGQQAYDQQMRELDAVIPELEAAAYDRYRDQGSDMLTELQLIGAERDREDAIAQQEWENQYKTQQQAYDAAQQDFENQLKIAQLEEEARANDMRYKTGNTYAAMSADKVADQIAGYIEDKDLDGLNTFLGLMVDDGMDPEQAWNIFRQAAIKITGQDPGSFEANMGG